MIALADLAIAQGDFRLEGIGFTVRDGRYAILMGASGSGKTSIIECICGLRRPVAGSIRIGERDISHLPPGARDIGYVPQDRALFPGVPVRRQIAFALQLRRLEQPRIDARVQELADLLEIGNLLDRRPEHLSGGEAQRVALARALAAWPRVLLLDEPLSALDRHLHEEVCALLQDIQARTGVTVLHVTHNAEEADRLGQVRLVLAGGAIRTVADERPAART